MRHSGPTGLLQLIQSSEPCQLVQRLRSHHSMSKQRGDSSLDLWVQIILLLYVLGKSFCLASVQQSRWPTGATLMLLLLPLLLLLQLLLMLVLLQLTSQLLLIALSGMLLWSQGLLSGAHILRQFCRSFVISTMQTRLGFLHPGQRCFSAAPSCWLRQTCFRLCLLTSTIMDRRFLTSNDMAGFLLT